MIIVILWLEAFVQKKKHYSKIVLKKWNILVILVVRENYYYLNLGSIFYFLIASIPIAKAKTLRSVLRIVYEKTDVWH